MGKKILLINGNPREDSLTDTLADAYVAAARSAGHTVQVMQLRDLRFDPILWHGYQRVQQLEDDLVAAQEWVRWAQHIVWVYPTWWGSTPALLKGFVDRVFLPSYAFKYHDKGPWWDRLLRGRSARIITTMDSPYLWYRLVYGSPGTRMLRNAILRFCGIAPVRSTHLGSVRFANEKKIQSWIRKMQMLGTKAS